MKDGRCPLNGHKRKGSKTKVILAQVEKKEMFISKKAAHSIAVAVIIGVVCGVLVHFLVYPGDRMTVYISIAASWVSFLLYMVCAACGTDDCLLTYSDDYDEYPNVVSQSRDSAVGTSTSPTTTPSISAGGAEV